jgi:chlorobactene glucosyltransferase
MSWAGSRSPHAGLAAVLVLVVLQLLLNLRAFRRLSRFAPPPWPESVSVLIPARNEAGAIEQCVRGWAAQTYPPREVLVLDDESEDDTRIRARAAAAGIPWVRILAGAPKPRSWCGKNFACHQLARAATGDVLVFADADVTPAPGTLASLLGVFADTGAEAVTVLPRHACRAPIGRHLLPLQAWVLACFHPRWLILGRSSPMLAAAKTLTSATRSRSSSDRASPAAAACAECPRR